MSYISPNADGTLDLVLTDQTEIRTEDLEIIIPLERKQAQLSNVEDTFKRTIQEIKIKLMDNPDFAQLMKIEEKLSVARRMKKENEIILNNEYKKAFKKAGVTDVAKVYSEALPEAKPKGKRGRPKLLGGSHE